MSRPSKATRASSSDEPGVQRIIDYPSWLEPGAAAQVEEAAERLLSHGDAFSITAATLRGRHLEISGRPVSGNAVMRIRNASGDRLQLAQMGERIGQAESASAGLRSALESAAILAWQRDLEGRLIWCNAPYVLAVEAPDDKAAVDRGAELFDPAQRLEAAAALREAGIWKRRASAVVNGARRSFEAAEVRTAFGSTGVAHDVSEIAALRARDGAQRGRLLAHHRPAVDCSRDIRQIEATDLL